MHVYEIERKVVEGTERETNSQTETEGAERALWSQEGSEEEALLQEEEAVPSAQRSHTFPLSACHGGSVLSTQRTR